MPNRRSTTLLASALAGLCLSLVAAPAEAGRERGRGWGAHPKYRHGWYGPRIEHHRGPPVVVVPPPVYRPPPVIVLPGYSVPYRYGYGFSWGYAPHGEAELRLRLPFR
jgi:hypothetical protein